MIKKYEDRLKEYFKNKKMLYEELKGNNNKKTKFCRSIIRLNDLGYTFTIDDFNNFLNCAYYYKGYSLIQKYAGNNTFREKIIDIMFNKFNPSDHQFDKIISFYKEGQFRNQSYFWIDILINKGYQFNETQKKKILKIEYNDLAKLYANSIISIDDLTNILEIIFKIKYSLNEKNQKFIGQLISFNSKNYQNDFMNYLLKISSSNKCKKKRELIKLFLKYLKPNQETNLIIIENKILDYDILYSIFNQGFEPTYELMEYFSKNEDTHEFIFYMKKCNLNFSTNILNNMINENLYFTISPKYEFLNIINYETLNKKITTKEFLINLGYSDFIVNDCIIDNSLNIFNFFTKFDIIPNELTLSICSVNNYDSVFDDCTTKYKLIPNKNILDKVLSEYFNQTKIILKILCYKIIPDEDSFNILLKNSHCNIETYEILIKFGLMLTFNNIIKLLKIGVSINNLERFNILYDNNLYFWCHIYDIFPEEYMNKFNINKKVLDLRKLCRNPKTKKENLDLFLSNNNIKLDGYCLEMSAKSSNELFEYMFLELKCKLTSNICYWLLDYFINDGMIEQLIEINKIDDNSLSKSIQS